jgi:type II secretory pathway pseudopilin PulG
MVELLIVVSIILLLSAISLPSLLRARAAANTAAAAAALRTIQSAEEIYALTYGNGYSPSLSALGPPANGSPASPAAAGLIDSSLAGGNRDAYAFSYAPSSSDGGNLDGYGALAQPCSQTGPSFEIDQTGVMTSLDTANAIAFSVYTNQSAAPQGCK